MDELAKELKIRKRVTAIFNKTQDDFDTKDAWDDYLEQMEDIIYNLANGVDVQATEAKLAEYERANRADIVAKQARQAEAQRAAQLAAFQAAAAAAGGAPAGAAQGEAGAAATAAGGYAPGALAVPTAAAPTLMAAQPVPLKPVAQDEHGTLLSPASAAAARPKMWGIEEGPPWAQAAGWSSALPRARALQEAFSSLLLSTSAS